MGSRETRSTGSPSRRMACVFLRRVRATALGRTPKPSKGEGDTPRGLAMSQRQVMNEIRLPSHDEPISAVTILDGQGRVVRVVPAAQFRSGPIVRRHPIVSRGNRRGIRAAMPDSVAVLESRDSSVTK